MTYTRVNWKDLPDTSTPITAENLNKMDAQIEENTNDIANIIESGGDANGEYIKYSDGTMICSNTVTYQNVAITNTWGSFYESAELSLGNYPVAFIQEPDLSLTSHYANFVEKYNDASATSPGTFYASKPKSGTENVKVSYIAIGRWK